MEKKKKRKRLIAVHRMNKKRKTQGEFVVIVFTTIARTRADVYRPNRHRQNILLEFVGPHRHLSAHIRNGWQTLDVKMFIEYVPPLYQAHVLLRNIL
jgi:hypothetical protein